MKRLSGNNDYANENVEKTQGSDLARRVEPQFAEKGFIEFKGKSSMEQNTEKKASVPK